MGVSSSHTNLSKIFEEVTTWPWIKVQSACKMMHDGEFDFAIDASNISLLCNCTYDDAKQFIPVFSKDKSSPVLVVMSYIYV